MVKPLDLPGGSNSNSNERTPLLSTSVRSTVSSRSGGFLGPHNGEAFHSARTRRASLAALAARGGESEFGGERPGLARFREEWALSQAPQHPTLLESTFGGQSTSASGAASRDRSRDPPSGGSGDALDTDDEEDDRPAEAGEILDQVRVLAEEAGYVVPPERKDATRDLREAGILAAWATPQILIGFCRYSIVGANLISLGRLGTRELAAGNLGFLSSNVGGYAIIVGLVSSMDTLANQAGKSASPKLSALYAMKTFVVCMAAMPFIFLFMWNGRTIFNAILPVGDRDPEIVDLAGDYLKIMSLAMPAVAAYECLRRYLQSFGLMNGPALAFAISSPVSIFLNWLLVHGPDKWRMGFLGAPVASVIAYNLLFVLIAAYTAFAAPRGSWCGFSRAIFSDLKVVLIFGLAGVASTCSEWYAFEAIGFGATLFSPATQAATAIYSTSLSIFYQVPLGLGAAGAIRVGNLLGRGLPHKAARSSSAGQVLTLCLVSLSCMFLLVWRHTFFSAFSSDPEVLDIVNSNVLLLVAIIILDGLLGLNAGVLRGAGLPEAAARINLFCYWIFGLPLGAFATWRLRSIAGLYSGLAVALALASIWMTGMIWRNDWDARAGEAVARIAVNDYDAKIPHSPPNERLEDVAEDEEEVLGNNQPRQVA